MRVSRFIDRRWSGAVGAAAAGLGAGAAAEAAVISQSFDPPEEVAEGVTVSADLGNDGVPEFNLSWAFFGAEFVSVGTKAVDFAGTMFGDPPQTRPGMAGVIMGGDHVANLAAGTLIGPGDTFVTPPILSRLNGWDNPDDQNPVGNFNGSSGYIGVEFELNGATHYGYVGFEGDAPEMHSGRVFALGWEDAPNTAIEAGAGISTNVPGDYNSNGTVDVADYTVWRDNVGGTTLDNRNPDLTDPVGQADYDFWKQRFGATSGAGGGQAAVPEPTSLALLAAGAAGLALYRWRREST